MNAATETAPTTETAPELTIIDTRDGERIEFDNAEEMAICNWPDGMNMQPMSNSAWHRAGQPNWYAKVDGKFIELKHKMRADRPCPDIDPAIIRDAMQSSRGELIVGYRGKMWKLICT
jgi:hypothetical protein